MTRIKPIVFLRNFTVGVQVQGVPDRSAAACWPLMGNDVARTVRWGGEDDEHSAVAAAPDVSLRFLFWGNAEVFSFWFAPC